MDSHALESQLTIDFRTVASTSVLHEGRYRLVELRPLHGSWMTARCVSQPTGDIAALCWECPLSPPQAKQLTLLLETYDAVSVELSLLPPEISDGVQQRPPIAPPSLPLSAERSSQSVRPGAANAARSGLSQLQVAAAVQSLAASSESRQPKGRFSFAHSELPRG